MNYEKRASVAISHYLHSAVKAKILNPVIKQIERDVVNPMFNVRMIKSSGGRNALLVNDKVGYEMWNELYIICLAGRQLLI